MLTKMDRKTTWRTQLIFKRISANFEARREKEDKVSLELNLTSIMNTCPTTMKITMLCFTRCSERWHLTIARCHICHLKNMNAF